MAVLSQVTVVGVLAKRASAYCLTRLVKTKLLICASTGALVDASQTTVPRGDRFSVAVAAVPVCGRTAAKRPVTAVRTSAAASPFQLTTPSAVLVAAAPATLRLANAAGASWRGEPG